jgi:alkylation response protein AidB-like acyl-CoA dehydrogenase
MASDFLTDNFPKKTVKALEESELGYSPELWKQMADLGWMGLALPDKFGGAGMGFLDLAMLVEEMGRACLPGPYFSTVILAGLAIADAGSDEQKQQYLPGIASGADIWTLALTEANGRYDAAGVEVKATADKGGYIINGTKLFVPDANVAGHLLVVARTADKAENGISVFIVDGKAAGVSHTVLPTIANDKLCEVVFNNVKVPAANILGGLNQGWVVVQAIMKRAAVAKCFEMVGCLQQALDITVAYEKDRKQFDKPIGSFQIIQHYSVDMLSDVEGARLSAYQAAWMLGEGMPCDMEIAVAKAFAGDACQRVMALAHQIHGAIGVTIDHDLQYYTRRAKAAEVTFGDGRFYREVVAKEMGL